MLYISSNSREFDQAAAKEKMEWQAKPRLKAGTKILAVSL